MKLGPFACQANIYHLAISPVLYCTGIDIKTGYFDGNLSFLRPHSFPRQQLIKVEYRHLGCWRNLGADSKLRAQGKRAHNYIILWLVSHLPPPSCYVEVMRQHQEMIGASVVGLGAMRTQKQSITSEVNVLIKNKMGVLFRLRQNLTMQPWMLQKLTLQTTIVSNSEICLSLPSE